MTQPATAFACSGELTGSHVVDIRKGKSEFLVTAREHGTPQVPFWIVTDDRCEATLSGDLLLRRACAEGAGAFVQVSPAELDTDRVRDHIGAGEAQWLRQIRRFRAAREGVDGSIEVEEVVPKGGESRRPASSDDLLEAQQPPVCGSLDDAHYASPLLEDDRPMAGVLPAGRPGQSRSSAGGCQGRRG